MPFTIHDPSAWTREDYLFGPGGDPDELLVSDGYATPLQQLLVQRELYAPGRMAPRGPETASLLAPGYRLRGVVGGLLAVAPDGSTAGGYLGWDLAVAPEHQGRGLGKEIVVEYLMRHGSLPLWPGFYFDNGGASYSPLGFRTHEAAWRLAQDAEFVAAKRAMLEAAMTAEPEMGGPRPF